MLHFEWDETKSARNFRIHGIDFSDVPPVFNDPHRITQEDSVYEGEQRWNTIGSATGLAVLIACHLKSDFNGDLFVRIISARRATPRERSVYEQDCTHDI